MDLPTLYRDLRAKFGPRCDPETWWPIYRRRTEPPEFERRAITNVLVTQTQWSNVRQAVEALDRAGLLTARGLAEADEAVLAKCAEPTGFQKRKAQSLKSLGVLVVSRFGTEAAFCAGVSREQLLSLVGFGPETADRILLYTCGKLVWPVDTYCLRVLVRHAVIPAMPAKVSERRRLAEEIKRLIQAQMPPQLHDWRRLHALMQLEGWEMRGTQEHQANS